MKKAVVVLSGGLDSTTLLYDAVKKYDEVHALTVNYGQRHDKEIEAAILTCKKLDVKHQSIDLHLLGKRLLSGSSLTSNIDVPEGHYADENMKQTVVPNRNMILLSLAVGYAVSLKADVVLYGAHAGDHDIYPDCRIEFIEAMKKAIALCDWHKVELEAPYWFMTKGQIVKRGLELGVPYADTWTCYNGREKACGKCGSCVERLEAFKENGVDDPIEYEVAK